ncbi:MAG: polyprenyl synthetase family protein [Candidatus Thermoplasmatota archaeon]|nr:polyprenyl synthetase family protein [Candidatus Thermoplasmatota archaeon]
MDVSRILTTERGAIEREIMEFFGKERAASLSDPMVHHAVHSLEEFTMRDAKRVRSVLAVMGYRAVGGKEMDKARKAAVALELIQSMLLIHDDIIDRSHTRRGKPSLHLHYSRLHSDRGYKGDASGFGTNLAIIVGDLAESFGEKALLSSGFPPERLIEALKHQTDMIRDTGYGQVLDLYSVELPDWSEEQVMKVHTYKTARYTLDGPLKIGASLHGASKDQLEALSGYALPVGVAFQLVDDIMGFFGDPRRGGRMDMSDIKEGKRTLLIIKALENGDNGQRRVIKSALGNPDLTLEQAEEVRDIIRRTGSEQYSREMARLRTEEGIRALEGAELDGEVMEFLKGFADYLIQRA